MVFETQRLLVRELQPGDFPSFHEMQANPRVMQYTTGIPQSAETNRTQLKKCIDGYTDPEQGCLVWAVVRKPDGPFVGTCAVVKNEQSENELGYRFLEQHWGRGYGREVLAGLIDYWLLQRAGGSLVAHVDRRNVASVRILETSALVSVAPRVDERGGPVLRFELTQSQYRALRAGGGESPGDSRRDP